MATQAEEVPAAMSDEVLRRALERKDEQDALPEEDMFQAGERMGLSPREIIESAIELERKKSLPLQFEAEKSARRRGLLIHFGSVVLTYILSVPGVGNASFGQLAAGAFFFGIASVLIHFLVILVGSPSLITGSFEKWKKEKAAREAMR